MHLIKSLGDFHCTYLLLVDSMIFSEPVSYCNGAALSLCLFVSKVILHKVSLLYVSKYPVFYRIVFAVSDFMLTHLNTDAK